jgi:hypothetical protein
MDGNKTNEKGFNFNDFLKSAFDDSATTGDAIKTMLAELAAESAGENEDGEEDDADKNVEVITEPKDDTGRTATVQTAAQETKVAGTQTKETKVNIEEAVIVVDTGKKADAPASAAKEATLESTLSISADEPKQAMDVKTIVRQALDELFDGKAADVKDRSAVDAVKAVITEVADVEKAAADEVFDAVKWAGSLSDEDKSLLADSLKALKEILGDGYSTMSDTDKVAGAVDLISKAAFVAENIDGISMDVKATLEEDGKKQASDEDVENAAIEMLLNQAVEADTEAESAVSTGYFIGQGIRAALDEETPEAQ